MTTVTIDRELLENICDVVDGLEYASGFALGACDELRAILATPRQQLAERDAEILEQCRLNGMGAERELKLMAQRDRLAGILESVAREHELIRQMKNCEVHRGRGSFGIAVMSDIYAIEWQALDKELQELIDTRRAALAEVKPRP